MGRMLLCLVLMLLTQATGATVYYSREEAMQMAFGDGAETRPLSLFLTEEQAAEVERMSGIHLDSRLYTLQEGRRSGQVLGYAAIETHPVRTQTETLLVLLSPRGEVSRVELLAFHEPPEYRAPPRWLERLSHRSLPDLRLGQGVDAIAGATLSSRAALDGVRKILSLFQVGHVQEESP